LDLHAHHEVRSALKVEAEVNVLSQIVLYALPGKIGSRRHSPRPEDEIDTAKKNDNDDRRPDPQTSVFHC
jgi:hypothetical protein